jgi:mono/diheme cytochrome c family protein
MKKITLFSLLLVVLILVAYQVLTSFDNYFKHGRMRETQAIRPYESPMPVMEKDVVPFSNGDAVLRATPAKDIISPLSQKNPANIALGKKLYSTYCQQCHGKYHDGNGTVGQSFYPLPGDLRSKKVQSLAEGFIFKEISYGKPEGRQPPLATTIAVIDRWRIISYIKSLGNRP